MRCDQTLCACVHEDSCLFFGFSPIQYRYVVDQHATCVQGLVFHSLFLFLSSRSPNLAVLSHLTPPQLKSHASHVFFNPPSSYQSTLEKKYL
jgi:hypothetical protein